MQQPAQQSAQKSMQQPAQQSAQQLAQQPVQQSVQRPAIENQQMKRCNYAGEWQS
jgi:hypothetical protein